MSNCYMFRHRVPPTGSLAGPETIYALHRRHWNYWNINAINYIHFASTKSQGCVTKLCDSETLQTQSGSCLYFVRNLHTNVCVQRSSRSSTTCTVWLCLVTCRSTNKGGSTLVTLPRIVTAYRDSVDGTRVRITNQKLVTR